MKQISKLRNANTPHKKKLNKNKSEINHQIFIFISYNQKSYILENNDLMLKYSAK